MPEHGLGHELRRQQAGWGAPRPTKIDPTGVVAIQFQVSALNATYDIWIDDVTFTCN